MLPFLKWAGGKRWLVENSDFTLPKYAGRYIEPFLGSGAMYFAHEPLDAILADANLRLIETYKAIRDDWKLVKRYLSEYSRQHCEIFYYEERKRTYRSRFKRSAQFLYWNRTCWNGLYRENLRGNFNVPIGTKSKIILDTDNFKDASKLLRSASIIGDDFENVVNLAQDGDLIFSDPPYTVAHNLNGFLKYNQNIFTWDDQVRLHGCLTRAKERGAIVVLTNAAHDSIRDLYSDFGEPKTLSRHSIISGSAKHRRETSELVYVL